MRGTRSPLVGLVVSTLAVAAAIAPGRAEGATTAAQVTVEPARELQAIACPSTTVCFGVGTNDRRDAGDVLATSNANAANPTWAIQPVPGAPNLTAISCASTTKCAAVGRSGAIAFYNGTTWSNRSVASTNDFTAVACPSATKCVAVGRGIQAVFDGSTWTSSAFENEVFALACPSTTRCVAVGSSSAHILVSDGTTWSGTFVSGVTTLRAVACTSVTRCVAVGADIDSFNTDAVAAVYDGTTWTRQLVGTGILLGVACPTSSRCAAITSTTAAIATGSTWTQTTLPDVVNLAAVTCRSASFCVAVGQRSSLNDGAIATYNGSGWSVTTAPGPSASLRAVACPSTSECHALGQSVDRPTVLSYHGTTWVADVQAQQASFRAVDCTTVNECIAVGESTVGTRAKGEVARYDGTAWSHSTLAATSALSAIDCPTTTKCVAVGRNIASGVAAVYSGGAWAVRQLPGTKPLVGVTCPSATFCAAWGGDKVVFYNGTAWTTTTPSGGVTKVVCPTATMCAAMHDANGNPVGQCCATITVYDGTSWTSAFNLNEREADVDCASPTFCMASAFTRIHTESWSVYTYDGTTWTRRGGDADGGELYSVDCASTTKCTTVGNFSVVYDGTGFTTSQAQGRAVACPSVTRCVSVGAGTASVIDGTTWSTTSIPGSYSALECPSATKCVAIGSKPTVGALAILTGTSWTTRNLAFTTAADDLACPSTTVCAITAHGRGRSQVIVNANL
jgi:hypothetical protein